MAEFKIGDGYVEVRLKDKTGPDLERIRRRLSDLDTTASVDINDQTAAAVARIRQRLGSLDTTATVRFNERGASSRMRRMALQMLAVHAAGNMAAAGVGVLTAATSSLGGAIAGTAPILVAGLGMVGGVVATLKVGTQGLSEAFEALAEGDMKKWGKAIANLSPQAREFALAIKDVWTELRKASGGIQDQLFEGMGKSVRQLGKVELPMLKAGMGGVATELNKTAKEVMAYIGSSEGIARQKVMWESTRTVVSNLRPAFTNITAAMFDLSEVGGKVLAGLSGGAGSLTLRFREWVAEARKSGELEQIMLRGVTTLRQLGTVVENFGGIFSAMSRAASAAGMDFLGSLVRISQQVETFFQSERGQNTLIEMFRSTQAAVDALMPGLRVLGEHFVHLFLGGSTMVRDFATTISNVLGSMGPFFTVMGGAIAVVARSLAILTDHFGFLLPVAAGVMTVMKGFALWTTYSAAVGLLSARLGIMAGIMAGSLAAGAGFANVLALLGRSLPIIGLAIGGVSLAYDAMTTSAKEAAEAVTSGEMTMKQAVEERTKSLDVQSAALEGMMREQGALVVSEGAVASAQENSARAQAEVRAEVERHIASLGPLEQAQARVRLAQQEHTEAVRQFGAASPEAVAAQGALAAATDQERDAQRDAKLATEDHTDALKRQQDQMLAMSNTNLAHRTALLDLKAAEEAVTIAVRDHGVSSDEAQRAQIRFEEAQNRVTATAGAQSEAINVNRNAVDQDKAATDQFRDTQLFLAATLGSKASPAVQKFTKDLSDSELQAYNAGIKVSGFHYEVRILPDGREVYIRTDPETGEVIDYHQRLDAIPATKIVRVTADGYWTMAGLTNHVNQGGKGVATGGVLGLDKSGIRVSRAMGGVLPGYSPGHDDYSFYSPSAGRLDLSGGEAIMRPEWTRAMGSGFVNGANRAARMGGKAGAQRYMSQLGGGPHHQYAEGGMFPFAPSAVDAVRDSGLRHVADDAAAQFKKFASAGGIGQAGGAGGAGYQWQMAVLRQAFPGLQLISGLRPGARTAATGALSWHSRGRAVDVPPRMDVFNWIKSNYGAKTLELIFSPANGGQLYRGRPHMYTGVTRGDHWDHVHWAYDKGGVARGRGMLPKTTPKPERVLSPGQTENFDRLTNAMDRRPTSAGGERGSVTVNVIQASKSDAETARLVVLALRGTG